MNTEIKNSAYSIQDRWINEIAPKYFDVDELNMLRIGQFGYTNEIMSTSLEDTLNMSSILYNEIFPNKAVLPNSIYSHSNLAKFSDYNATPAEMKVLVAIRKQDIIDNALKHMSEDYSTFFIGRDTKIVIDGGLTFMLEYPIQIIVKKNGNDTILSPIYDMTYKNENSDIRKKYIRSTTITLEKTELLLLDLKVRQMQRDIKEIDIVTNDLIDIISYDVEFDGMLSNFNVFYCSKNQDPILLDKYHLDELSPKSKTYCFYEHIGENKLRISFSSYASAFRPESGSNLYIEIFTTEGEEGNISYTGSDIKVEFDTNLDPIMLRNYKQDSRINYDSVFNMVNIQGDSINGANTKDLKEIKKRTIDVFSTRNSYITDHDLNIFFNNMNNDSQILFFKKRDDILKRIYSAFLLLRDKEGQIIPSNTVDIKFGKDQLIYDEIEGCFLIPAGQSYSMESKKENIYKYVGNMSDEQIIAAEDRNEFVLTNPYLIKVSTKPTLVNCYLNSIDESYFLAYNYINNNAFHEFAIDTVSIYRNALVDKNKSYKVSFNLSTTLDLKKVYENGNNIIAKGIIKRNGNDLAYFDFKPMKWSSSNNSIIFEAELITTDFVNINDEIEIIDTMKAMLDDYENKIPFFLSSECTLEIAIFYDGYDNKDKKKLASIRSLENFALVNTYETETSLDIVKNLSNIMQNFARIEGDGIVIKHVPMLRQLYIRKDDMVKRLYTQLKFFKEILLEKLDLVQNNFDIDLKFYNTYGSSKYFTVGTESEELNKVNIRLSFRLKLDIALTDDIIKEIKTFIQNYIERLNILDNPTGTNYIYISNLIRNMEQEMSYIKYTEFKGINNYPSNVQILENKFTDVSKFNKEQLINFVPEYLNINKVLDKNGNLVTDIDLEFI